MVRLVKFVKTALLVTVFNHGPVAYGVTAHSSAADDAPRSMTTMHTARAAADVQIRRIKAAIATNPGDTDLDMQHLEHLQSQLQGTK